MGKEIVEPESEGDPQGQPRYTRSNLRTQAGRLKLGSATAVGVLHPGMNYSLLTKVKRLTGQAPLASRPAVSIHRMRQGEVPPSR